MMKILFLMADDFPNTGACTSLLNNLLQEGKLAECFDEVAVATYTHSLGYIEKEYKGRIVVYHVKDTKSITKAECCQNLIAMPVEACYMLWNKSWRKIYQFLPGNTKYPVNKPIAKAIQKFGLNRYDIWVTFLGDFDFTAVSAQFKAKHPKTKLIVYQVDPCASNELYSPKSYQKRIALEQALYQAADGILTTPILLNEAKQRYGSEITDKMVAMEFPNVVPARCAGKRHEGPDIRCVFAGNIYGNIRNPDYTFRLFRDLGEDIQLHLYGSMPETVKNRAEAAGHRVHGPKSLDEIRSVLEEADFLVNIGNSMRNQVPSKIFEYISHGKPIVNICKNRDCPSLPYLQKYPYALNLFEDEDILEEQREMLQQFVRAHCDRRVSPEEIEKRYRECTPQYCAEQMLGMINRVCNAERTQKA